MPQSAALTQNMPIMRLKAQVSDSTRGTQQDRLDNAPPKSTVRKCCLDMGGLDTGREGPQAGQQSAPHMHVLVCICSNVRQVH